MNDPIMTAFGLVILIFSVIIHEVSHGAAAYSMGDPTAKAMGRLTMNPIPHIDLYGSIILPGLMLIFGTPFLFGYAKPVPVNYLNLTNRKWGPALVALAGPGSNFVLGISLGLVYRVLTIMTDLNPQVAGLFLTAILVNFALGIFNSLPIPPLDGFKIIAPLLPYSFLRSRVYQVLEQQGIVFLLIFIIFFGGVLTPLIFGATRLVMGI